MATPGTAGKSYALQRFIRPANLLRKTMMQGVILIGRSNTSPIFYSDAVNASQLVFMVLFNVLSANT